MIDTKAAALLLFKEGVSQVEISKILKRSQRTIHVWKTEGNWDKERLTHSVTRKTSEEQVWVLIEYQLSQLNLQKDIWAREQSELDDADKLPKLLSKGDLDALQKLFTTVKGKEIEWSTLVKIIREFMEHLSIDDLELAKQVTPHADSYINDRRKKM